MGQLQNTWGNLQKTTANLKGNRRKTGNLEKTKKPGKKNRSHRQILDDIGYEDPKKAIKIIFKYIEVGKNSLGRELNFWIKPSSTFTKCLDAYCAEMNVDKSSVEMYYIKQSNLISLGGSDSPQSTRISCGTVIGVTLSSHDPAVVKENFSKVIGLDIEDDSNGSNSKFPKHMK